MIQAYKGGHLSQEIKFDRYKLATFADSDYSTTTFKLRPKYTYKDTPFALISPFHTTSPIYFKQSLHFHVNKRHSFGIQSQLFRRNIFNMTTFGAYYEYTNIHDSKIRVSGSVGTISCCEVEYHKRMDQNRILSLYCSSVLSLKNLYTSLGVGYKYKRFQTVVTSRLGFGHVVTMKYKYPLYKGVILKLEAKATLVSQTDEISDHILDKQISLNYTIHKLKCSLIANSFSPDSVRVQFEARTSIGRIFICNEYINEQNIIYLGLKRHNCKITIPVAATNSFAVAVLFGLAYVFGYFLRKDQKEEAHFPKQEPQRVQELRLIEDKANEFYRIQERDKGLRVQYAYYGDESIINKIYEAFQTNVFQIPRQPIDLKKIIDVTVPMRYFAHKGKLKLPKTRKEQLLGFCSIESKNSLLLVIYYKGDNPNLQAQLVGEYQNIEI